MLDVVNYKNRNNMKTKITITPKLFEVSDRVCMVYVKHGEEGYDIMTSDERDEFIFKNYKGTDSLKKAKAVVRLLQRAIEFIDEQTTA
jgi:hypothetical protein